jgi:hypothetical protein
MVDTRLPTAAHYYKSNRREDVGSTLFQNGTKRPYPCVTRRSERRRKRRNKKRRMRRKRKRIKKRKNNKKKRRKRKQKPSHVDGRQGNST